MCGPKVVKTVGESVTPLLVAASKHAIWMVDVFWGEGIMVGYQCTQSTVGNVKLGIGVGGIKQKLLQMQTTRDAAELLPSRCSQPHETDRERKRERESPPPRNPPASRAEDPSTHCTARPAAWPRPRAF